MKRFVYIVLVVSTVLLIAGCVSEQDPFIYMGGTGRIVLHISADEKMQTRAENGLATDEFKVSIYRGITTVLEPKALGQLTTDDLTVSAGSGYTVKAESCSTAEAESKPTLFGQPRLAGTSSPFSVAKNETSTVNVECNPANAGVTVTTSDDFNTLYSGYEITTDLGDRELTFTQDNADAIGYYNLAAEQSTLSYTLTATKRTGEKTKSTQATTTLQVGKITQLKLSPAAKGTINLGITYDDEFAIEHIEINLDLDQNEEQEEGLEADPSQDTDRQLIKNKH